LDAPCRRPYTSAVSTEPRSLWRRALARLQIERNSPMSRRCELTGKTAQVGHKVSHSNRKTKRRVLPHLLDLTVMSDALGRSVKLRVSANALKSIDHRGGLDAFLMKAKDEELSPRCSTSSGRSRGPGSRRLRTAAQRPLLKRLRPPTEAGSRER